MDLERTSTHTQQEILAMREEGYSIRTIARCLRVSRKTIGKVYKNQDEGRPIRKPTISSQRKKYDIFDWCVIENLAFEDELNIKDIWRELEEEHGTTVTYKAFWAEFHKRIPHYAGWKKARKGALKS